MKRRKSLAKLFEATTIWAIVASVVGWLIYKEISKRTLEIEQTKAGRNLVIETGDVNGITVRSPLICQGLTVGKVTKIEANTSDENSEILAIAIYAQLDARYSLWKFASEASVENFGVMGEITGTPITLTFAGIRSNPQTNYSHEDPQRITLLSPENTRARLHSLLAEAETVIGAFTEKVTPPLNWPKDKPATRIDILTSNLTLASESLHKASVSLEMQMDAESEESLITGMHEIQSNLKTVTKNYHELINETKNTVAAIETRFDDTLGDSPSERALLRKQAEEVLTSLNDFLDRLDNLASRTGDTFIGRVLIRKPEEEESNANTITQEIMLDHRRGPRRSSRQILNR